MKTESEDRNKTKGISTLQKMLKYLDKNYTTPEAMALLQRQTALVRYYFPKLKCGAGELEFLSGYIKNKITAEYLMRSNQMGNLDKWFKIIDDIGKNELMNGDVTIEIR